jgi:hypothetical protein
LTFDSTSGNVDPPAPPPLDPPKSKIKVFGKLTRLQADIGRPSPPQSITIEATGLKAKVRLQASTGFQVSLRKKAGYADAVEIRGRNGDVAPARKVWVRLAAAPQPKKSVVGKITVSSKGAKTIFRDLQARVVR